MSDNEIDYDGEWIGKVQSTIVSDRDYGFRGAGDGMIVIEHPAAETKISFGTEYVICDVLEGDFADEFTVHYPGGKTSKDQPKSGDVEKLLSDIENKIS